MRLGEDFYQQDVLVVAPALVGKLICRAIEGRVQQFRITEVEAYGGPDDTASHAHAGRTRRAEVMWLAGGHAYVYLCYGIHHLLNVVTGPEGSAQAALIRGVDGHPGPGRASRAMSITLEDNRTDLTTSQHLWLDDDGYAPTLLARPRIGIAYAAVDDQNKLLRFTAA